MRRGFVQNELFIVVAIIVILAAILLPVFARARDHVRRSSCQANLKHIAAAFWQYTADNGGFSPPSNWSSKLGPYIKEARVFRCPSKNSPVGNSDYFFNAHLLRKNTNAFSPPPIIILMGDSDDDTPLNQLPSAWSGDSSSPAWRHLDGANYGFYDGRIKWLKPDQVNSNFRMVTP